MTIQTPEQADRARAAMLAMTKELAQLKADGEREAARPLAAQYTLLRDALQAYNRANPNRPPKPRPKPRPTAYGPSKPNPPTLTPDGDPTLPLRATIAQLKALLWEKDVQIEELRQALRAQTKPAPVETPTPAQTPTTPTVTFNPQLPDPTDFL